VWLKLRPLAYTKHPYQWATIGKEISHIENATMDDVKDFFFTHYIPNNAILVVAGKVTHEQVRMLSEKWFAPIPAGKNIVRSLAAEPLQQAKRTLSVYENVPANALYKAWHMPGRFDKDFYAAELLSDILSRGHSSRLYNKLVKEKEIFTSISSFTMGTIDPGMMIISGRVKEGIVLEEAEKQVNEVINNLLENGLEEDELLKVKNQAQTTQEFEKVEVMNRAMNLAFAALSGNADLVNQEADLIESVTSADIIRIGKKIFNEENSNVLYYNSKPAQEKS